jgi:hypothetical protein
MEWLSESGPSLVAQRIIEKLASAFATKTGWQISSSTIIYHRWCDTLVYQTAQICEYFGGFKVQLISFERLNFRIWKGVIRQHSREHFCRVLAVAFSSHEENMAAHEAIAIIASLWCSANTTFPEECRSWSILDMHHCRVQSSRFWTCVWW